MDHTGTPASHDHNKEIAAGVLVFAMAAFIIIVLPPIMALVAVHLVSK